MLWKRLRTALIGPRREDRQPVELPPSDKELLAELRREVGSLRFEWADVLDKINRWASRQAARTRNDTLRALELEPAGEEAPAPAPAAGQNLAELKAQLRHKAFGLRGRTG
jgi:hypothetical protein